MSTFIKSKLSIFVALLAIATLALLLYGEEPTTRASQQDSASAKVEVPQEKLTQEKMKEISGVVKTVDYETKEFVIKLSGEDSRRLGGMTEARIKIADYTKIKEADNSKGTVSSIKEGAPVEIKLAPVRDIVNTLKLEAAKVALSIACTKDQGCHKSGECGRACGSDACACPKAN